MSPYMKYLPLRRQFKYILNNFRLSKLEETMKKKISPKEIAALTRNLLKSS